MRVPSVDPILARGCSLCREWGSVVTDGGTYEPCPQCQPGTDGDDGASGGSREDSQAPWPLWQSLVERAGQGRLHGRAHQL
ncbi:hypothetical protein DMH25_04905 [Streptomyces sp. WAC 01325]|nr:hypothetical protein DMH25_04905 [Streptomyces sp. WAC 01325]